MANIVSIEPSALNPETEAWFKFDDGRTMLRKINQDEPHHARSSIGFPAIHSDRIDPCLGMDGRMHESLSSYRRTLKADGNPQGETYIELGNERLTHNPATFSKQDRRDAIKQVGQQAGLI